MYFPSATLHNISAAFECWSSSWNCVDKQNEQFPFKILSQVGKVAHHKSLSLSSLHPRFSRRSTSIHEYLNAQSNAIYKIKFFNNSFTMISQRFSHSTLLLNNIFTVILFTFDEWHVDTFNHRQSLVDYSNSLHWSCDKILVIGKIEISLSWVGFSY